ncbi:lytic transglycosylase domain-containing protein [Phyllobacterium endophyticum]|uniref:lytic transglycosylase domain-containing protein n=1 Tax=Phyllobacterium endophyticum TaxID=1149773 RepID=UPI0011C7C1C3|nr:lytic transglycosylase domain-containing protein [Phyllobacterium endophyticum]TXR47758.1 transglycosylase SLT domain-containing protein [Phyllobacterium endophyticum]
MTKNFGMIFALLGAMAFYGSNSAVAAPKEPTNLADYIKAKRAEAAKVQAASKTAKSVRAKDPVKRSVAKAPATKKVASKAQRVNRKASTYKRPVVQAKARVKTVVRNETINRVDTMTTGSVASAKPSTNYSTIISSYASSYGVPVALANAVVRVESNYRPDMTGSAGEIGLMQIKLETARGLGYTGSRQALYHPETNIRWGMKYLAGAHKLGNGTTCGTILRYNAGHGATRMNPISANYCSKVKLQMAAM